MEDEVTSFWQSGYHPCETSTQENKVWFHFCGGFFCTFGMNWACLFWRRNTEKHMCVLEKSVHAVGVCFLE